MPKFYEDDQVLSIQCSGVYKTLEIYSTDTVSIVEKKFLTKQIIKTYSFEEIDYLKVSNIPSHEDEIFSMELISVNSEILWSCIVENNRELYSLLTQKICKWLNIGFHSKILSINEKPCVICGRITSFNVECCLYCGHKLV